MPGDPDSRRSSTSYGPSSPEGTNDLAVVSSWERIERAAAASATGIIVSTGRNHGATRDQLRFDAQSRALLDEGERADASPGEHDFRPDAMTAALALHYLAARRPRFLFLGLGETDEFAHHDDYVGYLAALRRADAVIGELSAILRGMGERGRRTSVPHYVRPRSSARLPRPRSLVPRIRAGVAGGGGRRGSGERACSDRHHVSSRRHRATIRVLLGAPPSLDVSPGAGRPIAEVVGIPQRQGAAVRANSNRRVQQKPSRIATSTALPIATPGDRAAIRRGAWWSRRTTCLTSYFSVAKCVASRTLAPIDVGRVSTRSNSQRGSQHEFCYSP